MQNTFVKPDAVLPQWMASAPGCLFESGNQRFDSADARGNGLPVSNLGNGRTRNGSGIGQQGRFRVSHADQIGSEGVKVHASNPYVVSLPSNGLPHNPQLTRIRLNDGATIERMQSTPSRHVLAANINRLMASTYALDSNTKMVRRSKLGLGTIGRVRNAEVDATVDTLDKLADAFGMRPWQLLAPLEATQPPQSELPLIACQAVPVQQPAVQASSRAQELGVLFDLLTGRGGKIDQAEVFTAAVEAISRAVTGRHALPIDAPRQADLAKTQAV